MSGSFQDSLDLESQLAVQVRIAEALEAIVAVLSDDQIRFVVIQADVREKF